MDASATTSSGSYAAPALVRLGAVATLTLAMTMGSLMDFVDGVCSVQSDRMMGDDNC